MRAHCEVPLRALIAGTHSERPSQRLFLAISRESKAQSSNADEGERSAPSCNQGERSAPRCIQGERSVA